MTLIKLKCLHQQPTKTLLSVGHDYINHVHISTSTNPTAFHHMKIELFISITISSSTTAYTIKHSDRFMTFTKKDTTSSDKHHMTAQKPHLAILQGECSNIIGHKQ